MLYSLRLKVSDLAWSGSGDQGSAGFRCSSRLNLQLNGIDSNGQPKQVLVAIDGGNALQLNQGQTYSLSFEAEPLVAIKSVSLQFDQANIDSIKLDSLAVQSLETLSGNILSAAMPVNQAEVTSARRLSSTEWTAVAPIRPGVLVDLYDGRNFDDLRNSHIEAQVAIDDTYPGRYNGGDADTFSAVVVGELQATKDGLNQWQLRADDGVRLWIGDKQVVNAWKDQATWYAFSVDGLKKDQWYPIRIEYYENQGGAQLKLTDAYRQLVPTQQLRLKPRSPWQAIQGLHGTLTVDRKGNYFYDPNPFDSSLNNISADEKFLDSFELQIMDASGKATTTRIDIPRQDTDLSPLFAVDFQKQAFDRRDSTGIQTIYNNSKTPLTVSDSKAVQLQAINILGGDNDRLSTEYGNVWFHVLAPDGTRLPTSATELDPNLPTYFIVHGFLAGVGDAWLSPSEQGFKNAGGDWRLNPNDRLPWMTQYEPGHGLALSLLDLYRRDPNHVAANVVLVDWGNFSGSGPDYLKTARDHVPVVGQAIADYLYKHKVDPSTTTLIGHSLGGHISGFAGQAIQTMASSGMFPEGTKLQRIIGMDAAGPLFNTRGPSSRLSPNDAKDVFDLHTSDSFGFDAPLAKYDLYINSQYEIKTPYSYETMVKLAEAGWPVLYGAVGLEAIFNPSSASYHYDFTSDWQGSLLNAISGIDSHSYAVAFLAALIHEDMRIGKIASKPTPAGYQRIDDNNNPINFYDQYWGNTFGVELKQLQATNDRRVSEGLLPLTFKTLLQGADQGGMFAQVQQPSWLANQSSPASALDWTRDGRDGFGFLTPDQKEVSGEIPFSDYLLYWENKQGPVSIDLSKYNWLISPDFESNHLNGWTTYGPAPTIELGLLELGQTLADLWNNGTALAEDAAEVITKVSDTVEEAVNSAISAIHSGLRWIFGGPVVYGDVFFDERKYNAEGEITTNTNLRPDEGELRSKTDSVGRYKLDELSEPKLIGNGNAVLDYRDGLTVAGAINADGSISLNDSISGANMGFPLVGLPGGNVTLLTTLKYAALLRWRTQWDNLRIPVTPEFITSYYGSLIANTPKAFYDDNYTPYADLSSSDPTVVSEAIRSIEFTYSNLAIIKSIMELLRNFGLDYTNSLAWGPATQQLDPKGSDRVEIVAFSAYGYAMGQRFGQAITTADGIVVNPGDSVVGRPAIAPQFDLDNQLGVRQQHLRELIKEVLAVYPTAQLLADAPAEVLEAYRDGRSLEQSKLVDQFIETKLGGFLDRFSLGLNILLDAVHTRITTAKQLGSEYVIPGIAGPKRLVLNSLASELVDHAQNSASIPEFLNQYLVSFYKPETIDARDRVNPFSISISASPSEPLSGSAWDPSQGSLLTVYLLLTNDLGEAQPTPDQGLAVRMRFGGSVQEGIHYLLPADLADRTLYIPGGATQSSFTIQLAPGEIPTGSSLSIEVLSADSGYGAAKDHAVLNLALSGGEVATSGTRETFQPFNIAKPTAITSGDSSASESKPTDDAPQLLIADAMAPNVVLRGSNGRTDYFMLGKPEYGLPHIENFKIEDGDQILIDRSQFSGADRNPSIEDFNTYAGLVFDLVESQPLALISDYSISGGDQAWAGLSSSAGYYRFATDEELQAADAVIRTTNTESDRGGIVPESIQLIGTAAVVVIGNGPSLEVKNGEMGLGSKRQDRLNAVAGTNGDSDSNSAQPALLCAGRASDVYGIAPGGLTVIADVGGGSNDTVTGLDGSATQWSYRTIGRQGDLLLSTGTAENRTRVLLIDPHGETDRANRIEQLKFNDQRLPLREALTAMTQRDHLSYRAFNARHNNLLADTLDLTGQQGRADLLSALSTNLETLNLA